MTTASDRRDLVFFGNRAIAVLDVLFGVVLLSAAPDLALAGVYYLVVGVLYGVSCVVPQDHADKLIQDGNQVYSMGPLLNGIGLGFRSAMRDVGKIELDDIDEHGQPIYRRQGCAPAILVLLFAPVMLLWVITARAPYMTVMNLIQNRTAWVEFLRK